jgi:putative ABC transport system substrate-binding protein
MRRREFVRFLGGAAIAWPYGARAQGPRMRVIGYVSTGSRATADESLTAFRSGLKEMGFTEGQNVVIEFRSSEGRLEYLPKLMVDLVRSQVSAIFALGGDVATLVAMGATTTIPIVFLTNSDPIRSGLVASLNRPGANATGVTMLSGPLAAKRLQFLRELVPKVTAVGLLVNPNNTNSEPEAKDVQAGGNAVGLQVHILEASSSEEIGKAFIALAELKAGALLVNADPLFFVQRNQFITLAASHAMPTMHYAREFAQNGGLISYGANIASAIRQAGTTSAAF